jgi:demethylmenaquinone methyltransferase/2-methoxy-6-polyprenyl-1,4-benzoquinol methylase
VAARTRHLTTVFLDVAYPDEMSTLAEASGRPTPSLATFVSPNERLAPRDRVRPVIDRGADYVERCGDAPRDASALTSRCCRRTLVSHPNIHMPHTSQDLEAARTFYTRISSVYDALADRDEHRARELGLSLLDAKVGQHILEIGFGTGSSIVRLVASVGASGRVCGIDISSGMKAVAEQRIRSVNAAATVDLRVSAVPPIPFDDAAFDAVFMAFTLELFPDDTIPSVLGEVRRTLRTNGRFAAVSMALGTEVQRHQMPERIYTWMHHHFPHIVDCRPIDIERILSQAGFTISRVEWLEIWGLPVAACLAN